MSVNDGPASPAPNAKQVVQFVASVTGTLYWTARLKLDWHEKILSRQQQKIKKNKFCDALVFILFFL
jgi:hypothetical protein